MLEIPVSPRIGLMLPACDKTRHLEVERLATVAFPHVAIDRQAQLATKPPMVPTWDGRLRFIAID
jgi:hypothetical protein